MYIKQKNTTLILEYTQKNEWIRLFHMPKQKTLLKIYYIFLYCSTTSKVVIYYENATPFIIKTLTIKYIACKTEV